MFGMGGSEILVILIVALLFLGPDKLPDAAKKISKGIRDIKKQSRALQQTIEDDEHIGGALRDLRSALRGEEAPPPKPKPPKAIEPAASPDPVAPAAALVAATETPAGSADAAAAQDGAGPAATGPAKDPHEHDAEVAATAFADTFETAHMASSAPTAPAAAPAADHRAEAPPVPAITLPPTAGEPAEPTTATSHADADLAALVKPAPNTIARGSTASAATASAATASAAPASAAPASAAPSAASTGAASTSAAPATEPSEPEHG